MPPAGFRSGAAAALVLAALACGEGSEAGAGGPAEPAADSTYGSTLARLPVSFETAGTMSGTGSVTARPAAGQLRIDGTYLGLESPATEAHLHRARPGLRGPSIASLELAGGATEGTVAGSLELTADLRQALEAGELYVQIHSEQNPEGVLRGWLLRTP